MEGLAMSVLWALAALAAAYQTGAPCAIQHSLQPSATFHGGGVQGVPPPFRFRLTRPRSNKQVKHYKPGGLYRIHITGPVPFRGFLIQARLATKDGGIVGHLRAGRFVDDGSWRRQGIEVPLCPPVLNNSVSHSSGRDRDEIDVLWHIARDLGPIQFVVTIVQEKTTFWSNWRPKTGFVRPAARKAGRGRKGRRSKGREAPRDKQRRRPRTTAAPLGAENKLAFTLSTLNERKRLTFAPFLPNWTPRPRPAVGARRREEVPRPSPTAAPDAPSPRVIHEEDSSEESLLGSDFAVLRPGKAPRLIRISQLGRTPRPVNTSALGPRTFPPFASDFSLPTTSTTTTTTTTTTTAPPACASEPCFNGGICYDVGEGEFQCVCERSFAGPTCLHINHCLDHDCFNAKCVNKAGHYECQCAEGFQGTRCQLACPSYLCSNGGTCRVTDEGVYSCLCPPGFGGEGCRETKPRPCLVDDLCLNGGTCVEFEESKSCFCPDGWLGKRCQRPCVDFFSSCSLNQTTETCASARAETKFFDLNCPLTCGLCETPANFTNATDTPLPPSLEPIAWLVGRWEGSIENGGGNVSMDIRASPMPLFEAPSLAFLQEWTSPTDDEVFRAKGFIRLGSEGQVSLQTSSNRGFSHIEEGGLENRTISFVLKQQLPNFNVPWKKDRRWEHINEDKLEEILEVANVGDATGQTFATLYTRTEEYPLY